MKRRDRKRADNIISLMEEMQESGEGLHMKWVPDDKFAWEVRYIVGGRVYVATHGSLELALGWARDQAEFGQQATKQGVVIDG